MELDLIDRKILTLLQEDARTSYAELGRKVGLSTPSTIERVRRLEDAGVITGYKAHIDPAALGLTMSAIIRVTIAGERLVRFAQQVQKIKEVMECHRVTGGESFILRVAVRDTQHLEQVIDSLVPYVATTTSLVLASPVKWRPLTVLPERAVAVPRRKPTPR
ncbi:Lrp/AsnC family transcriptional regulator [Granulicella cerasi]|uniref:Lrp/AsnC family transcriptional regulator n=1 Tax=Granulicella cerasi TaxID=741063 RepID=A0ABW1Z5Z2_9BACT|nr:Lrp/AsnC family transcriptional regulator [Granulicella cerasi]